MTVDLSHISAYNIYASERTSVLDLIEIMAALASLVMKRQTPRKRKIDLGSIETTLTQNKDLLQQIQQLQKGASLYYLCSQCSLLTFHCPEIKEELVNEANSQVEQFIPKAAIPKEVKIIEEPVEVREVDLNLPPASLGESVLHSTISPKSNKKSSFQTPSSPPESPIATRSPPRAENFLQPIETSQKSLQLVQDMIEEAKKSLPKQAELEPAPEKPQMKKEEPTLKNSTREPQLETQKTEQEKNQQEKWLDWLDDFNDLLERHFRAEVEDTGDVPAVNPSKRAEEKLKQEEIFQTLASKMPKHIPRDVWEKPLKQWIRMKAREHKKYGKPRKVQAVSVPNLDVPLT